MISYCKLSLFILLFNCVLESKSQTLNVPDSSFVKFNIDDKLKSKADAEITSDKPYAIMLPNKVLFYKTIVSGNFIHIFSYKNKGEIVSIYSPNFNRDTTKSNSQYLGINYTEFQKLINQHDLDQEIKENSKIVKGRFFAIRAIRQENFYILYLNIKSKDIPVFNYSIKSAELK